MSSLVKLASDPVLFAKECCYIEDSVTRSWIPFALWASQEQSLRTIAKSKQVVILKARQLGFTWLALSYALHQMIFNPVATVLIFSMTEREANEALGHRLVGMYERLPEYIRLDPTVMAASKPSLSRLELANGSRAMSFPSSAGVSYTATLAIVDEADKGDTDNLVRLLPNVKPTIDAGGQLILLSTVFKPRPLSVFKNIYRAAMEGKGGYKPLFLPWSARPGRTHEWYQNEWAAQRDSRGSEDLALDYMSAEYPATENEALAPSASGARLPLNWLNQCFAPVPAISSKLAPTIPGLKVYQLPVGATPNSRAVRYIVSGDPAKGNVHSDDSASHVLRVDTGEEVAMFAGKHEMAVFGFYLDMLANWYNKADLIVERNSIGEATMLWLREHSKLPIMHGLDGHPGWHTSEKSKTHAYATAADMFRNKETILHSRSTFDQLASIEGNTLSAPEGLYDDEAMSYVLALQGVMIRTRDGDFHYGYAGRQNDRERGHNPMANLPQGLFQGGQKEPTYEDYWNDREDEARDVTPADIMLLQF